ncbi:hypothetical protein M413DRAFT_448819 [Hebeloma cylindrosporum]|uniref:Bromo domain-containing protein n=1 Tax=Hebeloma cylindrosporum TaxID=76867 RepID=A0A0C2XG49_HEBCY|nr:hypothetical protein M413DRAFT_448819 [Hebeloma cylindrosporum h7]
MDNRDAEPFLRPVAKTEVPDYYDVIQNPMDFQTMLKKVKQKHYKSKREFKDDLDLIWSNCLTYNADENHPLRSCVKRLRVKAEKLLQHITDRKERTDPQIPFDLPSSSSGIARPRINGINGYPNGHSSHTRSPSIPVVPKPGTSVPSLGKAQLANSRRDLEFSDTPAIIRTPEGMGLFRELDQEVGAFQPKPTSMQTLKELAPVIDYDSGSEDLKTPEGSAAGDKRKLTNSPDRRPRKRTRITPQCPIPVVDEKDDPSQLWWGAVQSDALIGNGLPGIPFGPSTSRRRKGDPTVKRSTTKSSKRHQHQQPVPPNPKSLLSLMNQNIKTMRRVRHTHAKFAALNVASAPPEDDDEGGLYGGQSTARGPGTSTVPGFGSGFGDDEIVDDRIDEAPWTPGRGTGKRKTKRVSGVEIGLESASDCLSWSTNKILEHEGFQGASSVALDVLADVTSQYLLNVGRTIRFLSDKFGKTMTPEEIILHTLFESGSSKIQDLERYIKDDIERYGARLGELEKKLVGAYRETTAGEALEDEGLFEEEDEEETGALAIGEFADLLGEDYLGLRELGIAAEFGISNLSIPKRLLKGKKGQNKPTASKPTEPPPPYPPPPAFVPLTAGKVDDQIGLLKPYYQGRFTQLAASLAPPPPAPSLSGPTLPYYGGLPALQGPAPQVPPPAPPPPPRPSSVSAAGPAPSPATQPPPPAGGLPNTAPTTTTGVQSPPPPPDLVLPDDVPSPAQVKIGPLGQILKAGATTAGSKKKTKAGAEGGAGGVKSGSVGMSGMAASAGAGGGGGGVSPKKKKGNVGVGTGNGRKKKPDGNGNGFGGGGGGGQQQGGQSNPVPAVIFASA